MEDKDKTDSGISSFLVVSFQFVNILRLRFSSPVLFYWLFVVTPSHALVVLVQLVPHLVHDFSHDEGQWDLSVRNLLR
jgi:hypothetical protein